MGMRLKRNSARGGKGGRNLRALAFAFGVGAVALAVGACVTGPATPPSSAAVPPPDALTRFDSSAEGVEIAPLEGTSVPMAKLLQRSVADAFGRYNVPSSPSPGSGCRQDQRPGAQEAAGSDAFGACAPGGGCRQDQRPGVRDAAGSDAFGACAPGGGRYLLSGHAGPNRDPAQSSVVAIEWRIFDRRQGREAGRFVLPVVGDRFAWDNGDPRVIAQVGDGTSRRFVQLVDGARPVAVSHGPAAEAARLAEPAIPSLARLSAGSIDRAPKPPPGHWSGAPPRPGETPGAVPPVGGPTKAAPKAEDLAALAPPSAPPSARAGVAPPASARNGPTVFLARVGGAPGDGDAALAHAARAALVVGGLGAAARREDARYIVAGSVTVATPAAGRQPVRIVWEVSAPDGRPLGRAVQENAVPEGSLNGAWGPMASLVAGAAVAGIADVIRRSEETAARAVPSESAERRLKIPPSPGAGAPAMPPPVGASAKAAEARPPG
jgi:hypothetical protein